MYEKLRFIVRLISLFFPHTHSNTHSNTHKSQDQRNKSKQWLYDKKHKIIKCRRHRMRTTFRRHSIFLSYFLFCGVSTSTCLRQYVVHTRNYITEKCERFFSWKFFLLCDVTFVMQTIFVYHKWPNWPDIYLLREWWSQAHTHGLRAQQKWVYGYVNVLQNIVFTIAQFHWWHRRPDATNGLILMAVKKKLNRRRRQR